MWLEVKKYLFDVRSAADLLAGFLAGKTFVDYQRDAMLRVAVERQLALIGEAVSQLARRDEELAAHITNYRRVIAFRNTNSTLLPALTVGATSAPVPQLLPA